MTAIPFSPVASSGTEGEKKGPLDQKKAFEINKKFKEKGTKGRDGKLRPETRLLSHLATVEFSVMVFESSKKQKIK